VVRVGRELRPLAVPRMNYPAKKDWWISLLLIVPGALLIADSVFLAALGVTHHFPALGFLPVGLVFLAGLLMLWFAFGTSYEITPTDLLIRFGPFRGRISLKSIEEARHSRRFVVGAGWGLALSMDRIYIRYRKSNGQPAFGVKISPRSKDDFLGELAAKVPGLRVIAEP
jgi:hypothetical protein